MYGKSVKGYKIYSSLFILRRQLNDPHFVQNWGPFYYKSKQKQKYHNFERNEDCATVFLKRTDFTVLHIQVSLVFLELTNLLYSGPVRTAHPLLRCSAATIAT